VCVITLIRGHALWGGLWIDPAFLHLAGGLPVRAATGTTQRPRIPDVGFRGLEVAWSRG
jgi:hypothetical protein